MFVVVTRHTDKYISEDQGFSIDFAGLQLIDKPEVISTGKLMPTLRSFMLKYVTRETANQLLETPGTECKDFILYTDEVSKTYTLVKNITLKVVMQQADNPSKNQNLEIDTYPIVLLQLFDMTAQG